MSTIAKLTAKDNNWQDGTTTYWFEVESDRYALDGETFGIVEGDGQASVVDCDGAPLINDHTERLVRAACVVTDEMRAA